MKNFYSISRGQLLTVWIFGGLAWCWAAIVVLESYNPPLLAGFLAIFIPFALIFYTIGWRNNRKTNNN